MSAPFEALLARIFVEPGTRARFKADPYGEGKRAGLSAEECEAIVRMDWAGVELASRSFAGKREEKRRPGRESVGARIQGMFLRAVRFFR